MLLRGIAVGDDRIKALTVALAEGEGNSSAHAPDSHDLNLMETRTLLFRSIH
jgi:hypothetical protein